MCVPNFGTQVPNFGICVHNLGNLFAILHKKIRRRLPAYFFIGLRIFLSACVFLFVHQIAIAIDGIHADGHETTIHHKVDYGCDIRHRYLAVAVDITQYGGG